MSRRFLLFSLFLVAASTLLYPQTFDSTRAQRISTQQARHSEWMFVAGNILLFLGATLDMWLPINKSIWTSSYSIFMAGWTLICFAMFYWIIDVKGYKQWAKPFIIFGMNAITVFVLSGVIGRLYVR